MQGPTAPAPPATPYHGALKRNPFGVPSATVFDRGFFSQFHLSFFRRRVGPVAPAARERGATGSEGRLRDSMLFHQSRLGTMLMLNKPG